MAAIRLTREFLSVTYRLFFALILCLATFNVSGANEDGIAYFETHIRPVLIKHCYECHSAESDAVKGGLVLDSKTGMLAGGESGPLLTPGKVEDSPLLEALRYETYEMPPSGKLGEDVIEHFANWIAMGAPDPRTDVPVPSLGEHREIDIEQGRQFWAFQPVESHVIPEVQNTAWPNSWIDNFVLRRLEDAGIEPVNPAGRATLLRRIAYDLTGLPPSLDDLEQFLYDEDPASVERFVDKLLESDRFGEHWGRHWLDVARYADSNGGDFNATFHHAWRYRNYIIESFNEDRPFDQMIVEQIAGDLLPASNDEQREDQLVATAFLMMGAKMLSERDKEKLRMDVVDEQVSVVGSAFLGMTLGCARCHDHKFDPIPTEDYYALAGIFRSTQTLDGEIQKYVSNWVRQPLPIEPEHVQALETHKKRNDEMKAALKAAEAAVKKLESSGSLAKELKRGILLDDVDAEVIGNWKASTFSKQYVGKGYIHDDRQNQGEKRVIFRTTVPTDGEYEVRITYPGNSGRDKAVPVTVVHADGTKTIHVDQEKVAPIEKLFLPIGRFPFRADKEASVTIANDGTTGYVIVDAVQFVSVAELESTDKQENSAQVAELESARKDVDRLKKEIKEHEKAAPPPAPVALAVNDAETVGDYNVCIRGEPRNLGPKVPRGFLSVATFTDPPEIAEDSSGRLALAEWVADEQNPLTARVYVNRVWHHLLGAGLVRTVDNFGSLGERPTHPELLDQLAVEFIAHDWSTKWLVREIVLSSVYQLASQHDESKWSADPENRRLWRAHRKRLSAEAIRDTLLLAGGSLELSSAESPVADLGTLVTQNRADDEGYQAESSNLRTLYRPVIRNELPSLMRVFDFADPDFVTGARAETNVPSQALWMLNGPFVRKHAELVAQRLAEMSISTESEQIEKLFLLAMGRPPTEEESTIALEFVRALRKELESEDSTTIWTELAHALFASSSFRMLD